MFLRNYDNIKIYRELPNQLSHTTYTKPDANSVYGDGSFFTKNMKGYIQTIIAGGSMFRKFVSAENSADALSDTGGGECYIKWSDSTDEVTYDEYTVNLPTTSTPVSVSVETNYDEEEQIYISTVKQIYVAKEDLTVGSIVVCMATAYVTDSTYPKGYVGCVELYREVLPESLNVAKDGSFALTFTIKTSANPNKPTDYVATASFE